MFCTLSSYPVKGPHLAGNLVLNAGMTEEGMRAVETNSVHRNFFPNRAGVPLSNGLEIRSLIEHSLLCPTLHRCSQSELEAHIAGVAVCNSHAAQAAWL